MWCQVCRLALLHSRADWVAVTALWLLAQEGAVVTLVGRAQAK